MRLWVACACAALMWGCANKGLVRYDAVAKRAADQDHLEAVALLKKERADLYGSQSRLLYAMDVGILYHYAGKYDSSVVYLSRAADIHEDLFARSVSNEAASLLVNDNVRPYRGRSYEITWLHLFLAFDYLALNRPDDARVEVRRAQIFLTESARKAGNDKEAFRDEAAFRAFSAMIYEALGEEDDAAISIYRAIKTLKQRKKPVPPGMAAYAWRLLNAADRDNDIKELGLQSVAATRLAPGQGEIIVVGALGRSPALGATAFKGTWVRDGLLYYSYTDVNGKTIQDVLPAPGIGQGEYDKANAGRTTRSGTTLNIKWAMPAVREVPVQSRDLKVAAASGGTVTGESWADTRELLAEDLEANRTSILLRTVARVAARTLAAEKTKSELRTDNPLVNLLLSLGTDLLADQLEQADVRLWFLLPRTLEVARLAVAPGTHTVEIGAENANGRVVHRESREVTVRPGGKTFVFFNSLK